MGTRVAAGIGALGVAMLLVSALWVSPEPARQVAPERPDTDSAAIAGTSSGTVYTWPLAPEPQVLREFDPPEQPWLAGHRGVDLAAEAGAPVYAAGAGVIAFVGWVVDRPVVSIDHPDGIRTTYEPVEAVVSTGMGVDAAAVIGQLQPAGEPHCAPVGPCLHWGARVGTNDYIDPLSLLHEEPPVIRLYPVRAPGP